MDEEWYVISVILAVGFVLTLIIAGFWGGSYIHKVIKYENFQTTIGELSDEQKCLHICGFNFPGTTYFDNYKYCVEKCDRISERTLTIEQMGK